MHPRNKLRLLAGVAIDPTLERVTEQREVPRKRSDLRPRDESTLAAKASGVRKALAHLHNAVKALERTPATDFMGDIPHYISEIEDIISADGGEAGLEALLKKLEDDAANFKPVTEGKKADKDYDGDGEVESSEEEFKGSRDKAIKKAKGEKVEEAHVDKDDDKLVKTKDGKVWKVLSSGKGEGDDEVYHLECVKTGEKTTKKAGELLDEAYGEYEEEPESFHTAADFKKGEKVMYDNGIWVVHIADAKADLVGIIPPSMQNASEEEKAKAMQQVKRDKIRKPSEEECEVMAGDYAMESTLNYTPSNAESHEENEEDPTNVVGQGKGQWANSLNPEYIDDKHTSQLDRRGDQSMDDYANKVKVPTKVKTALKAAISAFEKDAEKFGRSGSAMEARQFHIDTAEAFAELLSYLDKGTIQGMKEAQQFASSLMGPMLHKLPREVWDFIAHGGQKRSLKDYMNPVDKFPIEGPRNTQE